MVEWGLAMARGECARARGLWARLCGPMVCRCVGASRRSAACGNQRPAHKRCVAVRAARGGERAREARQIVLPVDGLERFDGFLLVQRAGAIELLGAGVRV